MSDIPKAIERKMPDDYDPGVITLQGNKVIWKNADLVFTEIDLNYVVVIGEYTNSNGPWFEDWFITFVTKEGNWHSISWYALNIEKLLDLLSIRFDPALKNSHIVNSTVWRSVVRYPISLEGSELFDKIPSRNFKAPKNIFQKFLYIFGLGGFELSYDLELSSPVNVELSKTYA